MPLIRVGDHDYEAGKWAVQNTFGGLSLVWGPSGTYKSFLTIHTAVCVASGKPWFGKHVHQGPVIYIIGEGGLDQFSYRAEMAAKGLGVRTRDIPLYGYMPAVNLADPKMAETLIVDWAAIGPRLIVVDTVSRCLHGDENKQEVMQAFVETIDKVKDELECTVIVVHHANKEGEIRGSTVLFAAADVSVKTMRKKVKDRRILHLSADKMKDLDIDGFYPKELDADQVDVRHPDGTLLIDDMGAKVATLVLKESQEVVEWEMVAMSVLQGLAAARHHSQAVGYKEWMLSTGLSVTAFRRGVEGLLAKGSVSSPCAGQYFEGTEPPDHFAPGDNYDTEHDEMMKKAAARADEELEAN